MIQEKLDIRNLIKSLNELEKLKLLLFDRDQYCLFEHIPKPILFDKRTFYGLDKSSPKEPNDSEKFLMTHGSTFWEKKNDATGIEKGFNDALVRLRKKKEPNVIDQRLIEIMDDFGS